MGAISSMRSQNIEWTFAHADHAELNGLEYTIKNKQSGFSLYTGEKKVQ